MKGTIIQVIIGILLAISGYTLSQAAGTMERIERRVDRLEVKVGDHCENFNIHTTTKP